MNVRKLHNDKFDSKKAAEVGLDASPKAPIVPDDAIIDLRNSIRDYYYFKDLQSATVLKPHTELRVSFPAHLSVFSKVTTQTPLKLLETYSLTVDTLVALKNELVEIICSTARFGETYTLARYDAICTAVKGAAVFGRTPLGDALRVRLYIEMYRECQVHLNSILEKLHQAVGRLEGIPDCGRISFIQTPYDVGFLGVIVLIAEMGSFDPFSSPRKLHTYFGLDSGVDDPGKFYRDRVHMSRRGSSLAGRVPYMVAINNLKVDKAIKTPVNPVIYDYYTRKCAGKKRSVVVGTVVHKICSIIFVILRDNKPFKLITPEEHRERYAVEHPESANPAARWRFELNFKTP